MIEALFYFLAWLIVGSGFCFILAAAFFGIPKEISEEEFNRMMKERNDDL